MAKVLKVIKTESGEPGVKCPRCDEAVVPDRNELFEGYNCPECGQTIDDSQMRGYVKHLRRLEYGEEDGE